VTRLFLDASTLLAAEDPGDPNHAEAVALLRGPASLATLDLAYYEASNAAISAWKDPDATGRVRRRIAAIAREGGLVRAGPELLEVAAGLAERHGISVYDAAYVAAAAQSGATLVSCDLRDLVSPGLAIAPADALAERT
jgi:predicted nucleic acid-binding protein